jgi:predicted HTH domain antitoxin
MYEINDLLEAKLYDSKEELLNDAIRHLFIYKPDLKLRLAIYKYKSGKISLAKAAILAGFTWMEMKEVIPRKNIRSLTTNNIDNIENKNSFNINSSILFLNQNLNSIPEENESPSKLNSCKEVIKTLNEEDKIIKSSNKKINKNEGEKEKEPLVIIEEIKNNENLEEEKAIIEFVPQTVYSTNESSNSLKDIEVYKQIGNRLKDMALESKKIDNELKQMTNQILN